MEGLSHSPALTQPLVINILYLQVTFICWFKDEPQLVKTVLRTLSLSQTGTGDELSVKNRFRSPSPVPVGPWRLSHAEGQMPKGMWGFGDADGQGVVRGTSGRERMV